MAADTYAPIVLPFESDAEWLAMRAEDVTSTDLAAILGVSPYMTRLEVWLNKRDGAAPIEENEAMICGRYLEPAIAALLSDRYGLTAEPLKVYMRHGRIARLGSSFDWQILACDPSRAEEKHRPTAERIAALIAAHGSGIFEIKNVSFQAKRAYWVPNGSDLEAPLHIELQVQQQLAVSGYGWAALGALFSGNEPHLEIRERHQETIELIESTVVDFWRSIESGVVPDFDPQRDLDNLKRLYSRLDDTSSLTEEEQNQLGALLTEYDAARTAEKAFNPHSPSKSLILLSGSQYFRYKSWC